MSNTMPAQYSTYFRITFDWFKRLNEAETTAEFYQFLNTADAICKSHGDDLFLQDLIIACAAEAQRTMREGGTG